ncbi:hypothetical protein [Komagataeibacter oboediens]|uniref:hypothetical protein n=1 Tax=Komagataeibacter oboediens TaxID=65958 RepID=UPI0019049B00|nr:hypothetical protein [Komagataeibacter oboediens]GCE80336.1 hypothetical protein MSKU3_1811 [Komagataeibacter oboediens]
MKLRGLDRALQIREQYRKAVKAFNEAAEFPQCLFPLGTHFSSGPDIAQLQGVEVLPLLGKQAARIAVELVDMGIDMQGEIGEHLGPYIMAVRDENRKCRKEVSA